MKKTLRLTSSQQKSRLISSILVLLILSFATAVVLLPMRANAQTQQLERPSPHAYDCFGMGAAMTDSIIVASAYGAASAYVFDSTGTFLQTLASPHLWSTARFGASIAISGNTVVVGAPMDDAPTYYGTHAGMAYVFDATTGGVLHSLSDPDALGGEKFGNSVAMAGSNIVVGAPWRDVESSGTQVMHAGEVFIFDASTGNVARTLFSPNLVSSGQFGYSVTISGSYVLVGAPGETSGTNTSAGHVYAFDATTGNLVRTYTSPSPQHGGEFGNALAASGATFVTGANGEYPSRAYVFNTSSTSPVYTLNSPSNQSTGAVQHWSFGYSVAMSDSAIVIGAYLDTALGYRYAGNAFVYDPATGAVTDVLTSPKPYYGGWGGEFGTSVATSGDAVVVGAPIESPGGLYGIGNVYLFPPRPQTTTTVTDTVTTTTVSHVTLTSTSTATETSTLTTTSIPPAVTTTTTETETITETETTTSTTTSIPPPVTSTTTQTQTQTVTASAISISCSPPQPGVGRTTKCTAVAIAGYPPAGLISFTSSVPGGGSFGTKTCSASANTLSCTISYVPRTAGIQVISATYSGDASYLSVSASTTIRVKP